MTSNCVRGFVRGFIIGFIIGWLKQLVSHERLERLNMGWKKHSVIGGPSQNEKAAEKVIKYSYGDGFHLK